MQLVLCKVLFPRLRGQSVCPFTFSVLLMMWEMLSAEHKRTSSPFLSNECDSQNESVGVTCSLERGLRKFLRLLFICLWIWMGKREITVIPAVTAQSLLIAFWTLTCFFFPTGKPNVLAQRDWLIAWLPKNLHPIPPLLPIFLNPTPALSLSLSQPLSLHSNRLVIGDKRVNPT